jgi:hypothetical protein
VVVRFHPLPHLKEERKMAYIKKQKKKLNVIVTFSDEPENPKDLADFFILLNEIDQQRKLNINKMAS